MTAWLNIRLMALQVMLLLLCILLTAMDLSAQQVEGNKTKPEADLVPGSNNVLVIYFSRTGNTEIMATEIAARYQAGLVNIKAAEYSDGFGGSIKANNEQN